MLTTGIYLYHKKKATSAPYGARRHIVYIIYSVDQRDYTETVVGLFPTWLDAYRAQRNLEDQLDDFHTLEVRSRDGLFI